jgi:UDP-N-acetylmuramate--alanine ligase
MRIFFSGLGGVGIGPLARIAKKAGYDALGSDQAPSPMVRQLTDEGIACAIGPQDGSFLRDEHTRNPIAYLVYTAALPADHPELVTARELGIMCLKRDGLLARIIAEKKLSMIAVAGTHGKTTTSGILVWAMKQLGIPVSYAVGTTLSFGPSGEYDADSRLFVYECDEYDRNFLHYTPELSIITSIDYDHPDTYPTLQDYQQAFNAFLDQSDATIMWHKDYDSLGQPRVSSDLVVLEAATSLDHIHLPGVHLRQNAFVVERALMRLFPDLPYHSVTSAINSFPGTDRRMERLADNIYSDYGHHPAEIRATLQAASEVSDHVVLVYQPHQNVRQHLIQSEYTAEVFAKADSVYWLPTYLSREDATLDILTPQQLSTLLPTEHVHYADLNDALWQQIESHRSQGHLVLCMGAGSIDAWVRSHL